MPNKIRNYLKGSGFINIEYKERTYRLVWFDKRLRTHINGLIREALLAASWTGLPDRTMRDLRSALRYEAQRFGLVFQRFVCHLHQYPIRLEVMYVSDPATALRFVLKSPVMTKLSLLVKAFEGWHSQMKNKLRVKGDW